jgi:copper chaperone CopZ
LDSSGLCDRALLRPFSFGAILFKGEEFMVDPVETVNIAHPELTAEAVFETRRIGIMGMTCDNCVRTIEKAFRGHKGVKEVRVDRKDAYAEVTFDTRQTNIPELLDTLLAAGYKPADVLAT